MIETTQTVTQQRAFNVRCNTRSGMRSNEGGITVQTHFPEVAAEILDLMRGLARLGVLTDPVATTCWLPVHQSGWEPFVPEVAE